jgi:hypothetical protein
MKKIIVILMLLAGCLLHSKAQPEISYNGYYVYVPDSSSYLSIKYYLRFYPDGTVIGVTTAGKPENLLPWFKKENKTPYRGKYKREGNDIRFDMTTDQGNVSYAGKIVSPSMMDLFVTSSINRYAGREVYHFMRIENMK